MEKNPNGWWFVNIDDLQGWVPATFLEALDKQAQQVTLSLTFVFVLVTIYVLLNLNDQQVLLSHLTAFTVSLNSFSYLT